MKAKDTELLTLLRSGTQRVIPIYQRVYSWDDTECKRLWDDIVRAGSNEDLASHFTGSIVYVERDQGTRTSEEPDLVIDGQQRVTTVMLLLAALSAHLEELPEEQQEPVDGFSPRKVRNRYLRNEDEVGDRHYKLLLSQSDRPALNAIVSGTPVPEGVISQVLANYEFFRGKLAEPTTDLEALCLGLAKLVVVDVQLTRGADDPQLVFETMNSTGKRLSQADLIRNFVLMDLPRQDQDELYEHFWYPMEQQFAGASDNRFDDFVRHYLTRQTGDIPRQNDIYESFKSYAGTQEGRGEGRHGLVEDLHRHSVWYVAMALGKEKRPALRQAFADIELFRATVVYPFFLRVYGDFEAGLIDETEFLEIISTTMAYLFRRAVCQIPTNTLNSTFATLGAAIDPSDYVDSVRARYLTLPWRSRYPDDEEYFDALQNINFYAFKRAPYFFRRMENVGRKEPVTTSDFSIEHIMPQNEKLSAAWRAALGEDWQEVHEHYLHVLGNLTLTGYNSEYSDRSFEQKRDMPGGFAQSPLRLNAGLGQLETWNRETIIERGRRLAELSLQIWPYPQIDRETVERHRARFRDRRGFDWTLTHRILEQLPAGNWTTYGDLAEAVGTAPQPLAGHVSMCTSCTAAYRVLTSERRVAPGFHWSDRNDPRDPQAVLESEGVHFVGTAADPEQRLDAEELLGLLDA